jgi:hypothetical protein
MALVLIPEDGSGMSNANSLISYANSLLYYERVPPTWVHAVAWNAAVQATREIFLVKASDLIKDGYSFSGTRKLSTQRLPFPRYNLWIDGADISSESVPEGVQFATAEFAGWLMVSNRTADPGSAGLSRLKVDVIELNFDKTDRVDVFPDSVIKMLAPFGDLNSEGPEVLLDRW